MSTPLAVRTSDRVQRLGVSLAVALVLIAADRVPIPVELRGEAAVVHGIVPLVKRAYSDHLVHWTSAALLVELLAALVPRWRPLRLAGAPGRARLWRATVAVGLVCAAAHALMVARWLQTAAWIAPGFIPCLVVVATLVAGTVVALGGAALVSRFGLGNGFSVLLASAASRETVSALTQVPRRWPTGDHRPLAEIALVALGLFVVSAWTLRRRGKDSHRVPLALPFPASGVMPAALALYLALLPTTGATIAPALSRWSQVFSGESVTAVVARGAVALVAALALTWAFNGPRRISEVWRRLRGRPGVHAPAPRLAGPAVRGALFNILLITMASRLALALIPIDPLAVVLLVAVALDLLGEWRARGQGPLVAIWPSSRPYEVPPLLAALRGAGIAAFPRGLRHRALLQALGPYVPVEILVPAAHEGPAREVIHAIQPIRSTW